jgi:hypothetical protein
MLGMCAHYKKQSEDIYTRILVGQRIFARRAKVQHLVVLCWIHSRSTVVAPTISLLRSFCRFYKADYTG